MPADQNATSTKLGGPDGPGAGQAPSGSGAGLTPAKDAAVRALAPVEPVPGSP